MEKLNLNLLSIEELRKKVKEKEESFKSGFKNPLDRYTDIDDLLRQNLEEQHITNQLLLHILLKKDLDGSIAPYQSNGDILERLKVSGDDYQTLNPIMLNVNDANMKIEGSGIIDTIKFVSNTTTTDNKDYTIEIKSDNTILYNNTFAELEARTGTERGMVCYEDLLALKYLLIFRTILYTNGFEIRVLKSKAKFESVQVKYHKKV